MVVAEDATAFPNRNAINSPGVVVSWNKGIDRGPHVDYIKDWWAGVEQYTDGFYTNVSELETQDRVNSNFRGNYPRLVELKDKYDPTNLFRLNANIKPSAA